MSFILGSVFPLSIRNDNFISLPAAAYPTGNSPMNIRFVLRYIITVIIFCSRLFSFSQCLSNWKHIPYHWLVFTWRVTKFRSSDETFDSKCINLRTFSNFLKFQNARFLDPYFVGRYFLWSHMIIQRTSTGLWYIELVIIFWYSIQAKQPEITPGKWYCWNYLCKYRTFFLLHDYFKVA